MRINKFLIVAFFSFHLHQAFGQVDLPTGAAQFKIPIMSYEDQNNLSLAVGLNYIAGNGLLVNSVASEVGTGWDISAGGFIVRKQRGLPDDQKRNMSIVVQNPLPSNTSVTSTQYIQTHYPNGSIYSVFNATDVLTNEAAYVRMNAVNWAGDWGGDIPNESAVADREQDIFTALIGNESIDFVIDRNLGQIRCLGINTFKIEAFEENMYGLGVKTTIGKFIVTSPKGIKYVFESKEFSEEILYDKKLSVSGFFSPDPDNANSSFNTTNIRPELLPQSSDVMVVMGRPSGSFIVTKWFLTEIINSGGKKITFTYEDYELKRNTSRTLTYFKSLSLNIGREILKTKRLTKISFPDFSELSFFYDPLVRVDVPNKPIKEIIQKRNNIVQAKTVFDYEYFYCSSLVPYNYAFEPDKKFMARLCLKSVQMFGNSGPSEPPYIFYYNTGTAGSDAMNQWLEGRIYKGPKDIVPPNFSLLTDHWGYYNSSSQHPRSDLVFRETDSHINYSWGYEAINASSYKQAIDGVAKNGILKSVQYPFGGSLTFEYEQNKAFYNNLDQNSGGVRVSRTIVFDGNDHNKDMVKEYKYLKSDNISSSGWGLETYTYQRPLTNRIFASSQGLKPVATQGFGQSLLTIYKYSQYINQFREILNGSKGAFWNAIRDIVMFIIMEVVNNPPDYIDETGTESNTISFEAGNPLPRLYSRVEILEKVGNSSPNGSTVFEFNSPVDLPLLTPVLTVPYGNQPRFTRGFYGLPKSIKINDAAGNVLKENINEYDIVTDNSNSILNKTWYASGYYYDKYPQVFFLEIKQSSSRITQTTYTNPSNFVILKKTKEYLYKPSVSGAVLKTQDFTYTPDFHFIRNTTTTDSKGNLIETKNYYTRDYNLSAFPVLNAMSAANMTEALISQEIWRTKSNGSPELMSFSASEFGQLPNGNYVPIKKYGFESDVPLPEAVIGTFNSSVFIRNSNYMKSKSEINYHFSNWPSEIKNVDADSYVSYLYGYNNSFQIAEIVNARVSEIAFNSFEESASAGGWIVSGASILSEISPTGSNCLQLQPGNSINTPIPINKGYTLSFWAMGTVNISGNASLIVDKPTINGWTYYEYRISSGSPPPVLTGSAKIDELRLYPENGRMVTTTYNNDGLVTSVCDINNRISYKSYDQAGRIDTEFDEYRNLIKTYEYRYKNLP